MTWGEFKEKMQQRGVTDDTPIDFIDWTQVWGDEFDIAFTASGCVYVLNAHGGRDTAADRKDD